MGRKAQVLCPLALPPQLVHGREAGPGPPEQSLSPPIGRVCPDSGALQGVQARLVPRTHTTWLGPGSERWVLAYDHAISFGGIAAVNKLLYGSSISDKPNCPQLRCLVLYLGPLNVFSVQEDGGIPDRCIHV